MNNEAQVKPRNISGIGLVEVLIAAAILAVIAFSASQLMSGLGRNMASLTQKGEAEEVRAMLQRRLSCTRTFPAGTCAAGPRGQVLLKDTFGNDIFTDYDDTDAASLPTKAVFRDSFRWGNSMARIQARCGPAALEVRVVSWMTPEKAWPTVAPIQLCHEVLGGPPPPCPPTDAPLVLDGVTRCTPRMGLCLGLGFQWDAATSSCYPPVSAIYGGGFQRGENPVAGPPDCETANPSTGNCSCPAGFFPYSAGLTIEPAGMWDHNYICLRAN